MLGRRCQYTDEVVFPVYPSSVCRHPSIPQGGFPRNILSRQKLRKALVTQVSGLNHNLKAREQEYLRGTDLGPTSPASPLQLSLKDDLPLEGLSMRLAPAPINKPREG